MTAMNRGEDPAEFSGSDSGQAVRSYDFDTIDSAMLNFNFPASKHQVLADVGQAEILWKDGETLELHDVIRDIPQERFESMEDLKAAMRMVIQLSYFGQVVEDQSMIITE